MNRAELLALAEKFWMETPLNLVSHEEAIAPELTGMAIFDRPIAGVSVADDPAFTQLLDPSVIGPHLMLPSQWLPNAKSVVSFFFPFTKAVRRANVRDMKTPAPEWLHGRWEGQAMMNALVRFLMEALERGGIRAVVPTLDSRFWSRTRAKEPGQVPYTSNWSERHVAYVCGLGTFGLSKGLITEKGTAGRFISLITDLVLAPDIRSYTVPNEYCIRCGACVRNCPVGAISLEHGKDQELCGNLVDAILQKYRPRYGCGKCEVGVPCETTNPAARYSSFASY